MPRRADLGRQASQVLEVHAAGADRRIQTKSYSSGMLTPPFRARPPSARRIATYWTCP